LQAPQYVYFATLARFLDRTPVWLDVGCGRAIVPEWFHPTDLVRYQRAVDRAKMLVGIDDDEKSLRDSGLVRKVRGNIETLPFATGTFDLVSANMVVEHLQHPEPSLLEIARILKPSGILVFHTVNLRSPFITLQALAADWLKRALIRLVESRKDEDVFKAYYRLNTSSTIEKCAEAAGFRVVEIKTVCSPPMTWGLGPLAAFELLIIRLLGWEALGALRPNLIAVLERAS
jgi:SAM-dependent methyltransferase